MLELYHHGSSVCAAKVRFALAEKQLVWIGHVVDILRGEQFQKSFLTLNAKAVVPVLVHDRLVITESTVICEYLEETFALNPLFPSTAWGRAQMRYWTKAVDEDLHPACSALTYIVSHRHTILRHGAGSFDDFIRGISADAMQARLLKWSWIQQGLQAPGAADKIRLYDAYLRKMNAVLADSQWLLGERFSMADVALAPYVNRIAALSMQGLWRQGRLPHVERWFLALQDRSTFNSAFVQWLPEGLGDEMRENGAKSWPEVQSLLS
jgi:glutathione S-transferase